MFGRPEVAPLDLVRESKGYAEATLTRSQEGLEREASGETARSISGMWGGGSMVPDPPAEPYERPSVEELLGLEPAAPK